MRDGQTLNPHRPRLVVSHSTCPPLSSSPHAHSFVIGPAVIKHTHDHAESQGKHVFITGTAVINKHITRPLARARGRSAAGQPASD